MGIRAKLRKHRLAPVTFGGESCYVKFWSEAERIEWSIEMDKLKAEAEQNGTSDDLERTMRSRILAWFLCDETGTPLFGRDEWKEVHDFPGDDVANAFEAWQDMIGAAIKKKSPSENPPPNDSSTDSPTDSATPSPTLNNTLATVN